MLLIVCRPIVIKNQYFRLIKQLAPFVLNKKSLGIAIRQLRVQLELSQEELADKCGLHRTYIGSVERGERNIAIDNVIKLSIALNCRVSDIILLAENMDEF